MNFYEILEEVEEGYTLNPFASNKDGKFVEGATSIDYLNNNFGHLNTADEMINSTEIEGFKLFFAWLKDKGILN